MEWRDRAFVLAARRHGENGAIIELLTEHFLVHHVFVPLGRTLPAARSRLVERMRRAVTASTMDA